MLSYSSSQGGNRKVQNNGKQVSEQQSRTTALRMDNETLAYSVQTVKRESLELQEKLKNQSAIERIVHMSLAHTNSRI